MKASGRTYGQLQIEEWLASRPPPIVTTKVRAKAEDPFRRLAEAEGYKQPIDVEARLSAMRFKGPGWVVEKVFDATMAAVEGRPDWNWTAERRGLERIVRDLAQEAPGEAGQAPPARGARGDQQEGEWAG
jgi:hypothetical protein